MATNALSTTVSNETPLNLAGSPEFAQTMSSREIAALLCKRHDNVMRDTKAMLLQLHGAEALLKFEGSYIGQDRTARPCFNIPKRETLILISGYNVAMRAQIIDRWEELEARGIRADRLLLASHGEEISRLKNTNTELKARVMAKEEADFLNAQKSKKKVPAIETMIELSFDAILPTMKQQASAWLLGNYSVRVQPSGLRGF